MKESQFKTGDVVVFDPSTFIGSFSEEHKLKYYGDLGYGVNKPKLFVFLCHIRFQGKKIGHCALVDIKSGEIKVMVHESNFRLAHEEEF